MITCPKCSKDNQDHYKFCLGCGAELPRDVAPKPFANRTPPHGMKPAVAAAAAAPPAGLGGTVAISPPGAASPRPAAPRARRAPRPPRPLRRRPRPRRLLRPRPPSRALNVATSTPRRTSFAAPVDTAWGARRLAR